MKYPGLVLQVDFSKHMVAAILYQKTKEGERFISARTRRLKPYKWRYCSIKEELLELVHWMDKFTHILSCQKFTVVSFIEKVCHCFNM